jgi:rsbT antagonist protein RsbS
VATPVARIPLQVSNQCLVASIQVDLNDAVLAQFRDDLLRELQAQQAQGVILDLSGIEVMDLSDFENIRSTISMAELMGVTAVVCGLRPGVVASLILLGAQTDELKAARDLDMAFELLGKRKAQRMEGTGDEGDLVSNHHP